LHNVESDKAIECLQKVVALDGKYEYWIQNLLVSMLFLFGF
jgi:hypothetical protein